MIDDRLKKSIKIVADARVFFVSEGEAALSFAKPPDFK